jgi:hypothetical protein
VKFSARPAAKFAGRLPASLKNQFNAPFQAASCDRLNRRRASTSAMKLRAEATVARCRDRLQKIRYSTMASRYVRRSNSLSRTRVSTSAQSGNQTPVAAVEAFIYQFMERQTQFVFRRPNIQAQKPERAARLSRRDPAKPLKNKTLTLFSDRLKIAT